MIAEEKGKERRGGGGGEGGQGRGKGRGGIEQQQISIPAEFPDMTQSVRVKFVLAGPFCVPVITTYAPPP